MRGDVVSVERRIGAPPQLIFNLVADAARHPDIDGSGSVRRAKPGHPQRLHLRARFGMAMQAGMKYSMINTVEEFEENRLIAWRPMVPGIPGLLVGGRLWRYQLEPVDGGTRVRETWDISRDRQRFFLRRFGIPRKTEQDIQRTLGRIEALVAPPPAPVD